MSTPSPAAKAVAAYLSNPLVLFGGFVTVGWLVVAIFAPWIAPYDPLATILPLAPPLSPNPAGGTFWLGTDLLGRDVLSRLIFGARTVIVYATLATLTAYAVGSSAASSPAMCAERSIRRCRSRRTSSSPSRCWCSTSSSSW